MREYIQALPPKVEFAVVALIAFGYPVLGNTIETLRGGGAGHISESHLRFLIVYELIVLALLGAFLRLRGWSPQRIGLRPTLRESGIGLLLCLGAYIAIYGTWLIAIGVSHQLGEAARNANFVVPGFTLGSVFAASALNGFFEEVFLCGYMMTVLKERSGFWTAVNAVLAIRLSYHMYQGVIGVVTVIPVGLIFGLYYARTGRLWPLVIAHAIIDLIALLAYA